MGPYGNIAKWRAVLELAGAPAGTRILDYGAGRGEAWTDLLAHRADLKLFAFEPDEASRGKLRRNVECLGGKVLTELASMRGLNVDYVVSFSVLEHVYDRAEYLEVARDAMADGGAFILNYDDGHFRPDVQLGDARGRTRAVHALREALGNAIWPSLAKFGVRAPYQSRVNRADVEDLIRQAGLVVEEDRYENLVSLKALSKLVPPGKVESFHKIWAEFENALNTELGDAMAERYGDTQALWQVMPTRTLRLRKR